MLSKAEIDQKIYDSRNRSAVKPLRRTNQSEVVQPQHAAAMSMTVLRGSVGGGGGGGSNSYNNDCFVSDYK